LFRFVSIVSTCIAVSRALDRRHPVGHGCSDVDGRNRQMLYIDNTVC
jgi:hypothetical protein